MVKPPPSNTTVSLSCSLNLQSVVYLKASALLLTASNMLCRRFSVPLLLVLLSACAAKKPAGPSALETDYQLKMEDADSSFDKGCFVCKPSSTSRKHRIRGPSIHRNLHRTPSVVAFKRTVPSAGVTLCAACSLRSEDILKRTARLLGCLAARLLIENVRQ